MSTVDRQTRTQLQADHRGLLGYRLYVASGPEKGATVLLDRLKVTIGNLETCDLVLQDDFVSRKHCEIVLEKGAHYLTDLSSKNGTFVNGLRVTRVKLIPGAIIRIGQADILYQVNDALDAVAVSDSNTFGSLVGRTANMRKLFTLLEQVAPTDLTLLVHGETGTGKEVLAKSVHQKSAVANGPFVVVDCGAIAGNLIESELFGHEKGAFTGASQQHRGAFERAHAGTIFLDEIGELALDLQPKLLRVLEQREVQRIGGSGPVPVNVRVIAATHRDLAQEVQKKTFRQDLYYRLSVVKVKLPALRERREDIPLLSENLMKNQTRIEGISAEALSLLVGHSWPGNVRELRNVMQRGLALARGPMLEAKDLHFEAPLEAERPPEAAATAGAQTLEESERELILMTLKKCRWNKSEAAKQLNIASSTLYSKIKKHHIEDPE